MNYPFKTTAANILNGNTRYSKTLSEDNLKKQSNSAFLHTTLAIQSEDVQD